jgi:hypothetical protein
MARAHFVKSARKDNPVAKKGESYWWWKHMVGGRGGAKQYSKECPKPSQLTQSEFLSRFYDIEEQISEAKDPDTLESIAQELGELGDEQREKHDNMPDGLRDGDTGTMLDERSTGCDEWRQEIERVAEELREKIDAREALREEWKNWNEQEQSNLDNDLEDDEFDEPSEEEPPADDEDIIAEAIEEIQGSAPSF